MASVERIGMRHGVDWLLQWPVLASGCRLLRPGGILENGSAELFTARVEGEAPPPVLPGGSVFGDTSARYANGEEWPRPADDVIGHRAPVRG